MRQFLSVFYLYYDLHFILILCFLSYACHALQREPHLVLLDTKWYAQKLRPCAAQLAALWLCQESPAIQLAFTPPQSNNNNSTSGVEKEQGEKEKDQRARRLVERYLTAPLDELQGLSEWVSSTTTTTATSAHQTAASVSMEVDGEISSKVSSSMLPLGLGVSQVKLLNLARTWVLTLLPHVVSKIHRVSFGILRPSDLAMVDPKSPPSRRLLAVPFVGKDVPSRASEFAHPDVLIGLSILAYRYDGARQSDVLRLATQLKQDLSRQVRLSVRD